jgi:hypothetical protein
MVVVVVVVTAVDDKIKQPESIDHAVARVVVPTGACT